MGQNKEPNATSPNVISKQSHSMPQLNTTLQPSTPKIIPSAVQTGNTNVRVNSANTIQINPNTSENSEIPAVITNEMKQSHPVPTMPISVIIKGLIEFLSKENVQPLWNYEDITAKGK